MQTDWQGKQTFFDRWALSYDRLFPSVVYQAIHQRLLSFVQLKAQAHVLDLGCGTGKLLKRLLAKYPEVTGTGLDLSSEMIHQAKLSNPAPDRATFQEGNAEALPFEDSQFDAVFNTISFLHYRNPDRVFAEVKRVLQPDGQFYLVDSAFRWQPPMLTINFSPGGLRLYNTTEREILAHAAGLTCLGHQYLLGPVVLSQFLKPQIT